MYRVWTKDFRDGCSIMTDWQTYTQCKRFIIGRWHHWPPFAFVSKAKNAENFFRYN